MQVSDATDCDELAALVDALDYLKKDAEQKLSIKKATQASMESGRQSTHTDSANQGLRRSHRIASASGVASAGSLFVTEYDTESESSNEDDMPSIMFHEASPNEHTTMDAAPGNLSRPVVNGHDKGTGVQPVQLLDGASNAEDHQSPSTDPQYQAAEDLDYIGRQPGLKSPHYSLVSPPH